MSDFVLMAGDRAVVLTKEKFETWTIVYGRTMRDKIAVKGDKRYRVWFDQTGQYRVGRGVVVGYQ